MQVETYPSLQGMSYYNVSLPENITIFLDKIYKSLENASYEELIEITHEDTAWK